MTVDSDGVLKVQAFDTSLAANTYTVSVQNTITVTQNGQFGTANEVFAPSGVSDKVEFTITLEDGCSTATINSPTLSASYSVDDGLTQTATFTDASDTFGISISQSDFCGRRVYEIQEQGTNNVVSWATVA